MKQKTHLKLLLVLTLVLLFMVLAVVASYLNPAIAFIMTIVVIFGWRGYLEMGYPPLNAIDLLAQGYFDSTKVAKELQPGDEIRALVYLSPARSKWISFIRKEKMEDQEIQDWIDNFSDVSVKMYVVRNYG